jgi:hypothetical protein
VPKHQRIPQIWYNRQGHAAPKETFRVGMCRGRRNGSGARRISLDGDFDRTRGIIRIEAKAHSGFAARTKAVHHVFFRMFRTLQPCQSRGRPKNRKMNRFED